MKNINIPEPCSEDWNQMTSNEKGAFCEKCALDVYDFTNKSSDEIREILTLNIASPVCMRIEPKQLDQLNEDFSAWKIINKHSYQRAWVFTLLVIFGMTLFSCEEDEKPVVEEYQRIGQTILKQEDEKKVIDHSSKTDTEIKSVSLNEDQPKSKEKTRIDSDTKEIKEELMMLGKVSAEHKTIPNQDEVLIRPSEMREVHRTAGIPRMSPEYNAYLIETYEGVVDSVDVSPDPKITGLVYPNPASNQTTLQLNMPKKGKGTIELFALSGQRIRTIHSGRLQKGESEFPIDLTALQTGTYFVVIQSGRKKETVKITKV